MLHHVDFEVALPHELLPANSTFELVMNLTMFRALFLSRKRLVTKVTLNRLNKLKYILVFMWYHKSQRIQYCIQ